MYFVFRQTMIFLFIITLFVAITILLNILGQQNQISVIYRAVDEEYVPNTMIPYSKKYHLSCKGLFTKGTLIQPCSNESKLKDCARNVAEEWKPDGCKLKYYTKEDMITCLKTFSKTDQKTLHFIGDSRVRWVFETLKSKYSGKPVIWTKSDSMYIKEANVTFILDYHPYINPFRSFITKILKKKEKPIVVYLADSLHHIFKKSGKDPFKTFKEFEETLTDMIPTMNRMADVTKTVWPLLATVVGDGEVNESKIPNRVHLVDLYNDGVNKILKPTNVTLIYSIRSLGKATLKSYKDTTHLGFKANVIIVEMLLNYICNNQWQQTDVQDNDKEICCSKQDKLT